MWEEPDKKILASLIGEVITRASLIKESGGDCVEIETDSSVYKMYHQRDCCEHVYLDYDSEQDLQHLVGQRVVNARLEHNTELPPLEDVDVEYLWTFYIFELETDTVVLRWFGTSNGYYSMDVSIRKKSK